MESSKKKINCLIHPRETLTRIDSDLKAEKRFYCIECLMDLEGNFDRKRLIPFMDYINQAFTSKSNTKQTLNNPSRLKEDLISGFKKTLEKKDEEINKITLQVEKEKIRIAQSFEDIVLETVGTIEKIKSRCLERLDNEVETFKKNYENFATYISILDEKLENPIILSKDEVVTKFESTQNHEQLLQFFREFHFETSEVDLVLHGKEIISSMQKLMKMNLNATPTFEFAESNIFDNISQGGVSDKIKEAIHNCLYLHSRVIPVLPFSKPTKSNILKQESIDMIRGWLPSSVSNLQIKEPVFIQTSSSDAMNNFVQSCRGKGPTIIVMKSNTGEIFGGFMDEDWSNHLSEEFYSENAFLFSVSEKKKFESKTNVVNGYFDTRCGPCFMDLYVDKKFFISCTPSAYKFSEAKEIIGTNSKEVESIEIFSFEK